MVYGGGATLARRNIDLKYPDNQFLKGFRGPRLALTFLERGRHIRDRVQKYAGVGKDWRSIEKDVHVVPGCGVGSYFVVFGAWI